MPSFTEHGALLQQLQLLGLTDDAFRVLRPNDTVSAYVGACLRRGGEQLEPVTERLHQQLMLVRDAYTRAGFRSGREAVFCALATAVKAEIPN